MGTNKQTDRITDAHERLTHATTVCVNNEDSGSHQVMARSLVSACRSQLLRWYRLIAAVLTALCDMRVYGGKAMIRPILQLHRLYRTPDEYIRPTSRRRGLLAKFL